LTLQEPIEFDAPDDQAVDVLFVLLVPEEANQQHLEILSGLARRFSQPDYCASLRSAQDSTSLYQAAIRRDE
jgi:PTS system nitrogen regulatory IIA component